MSRRYPKSKGATTLTARLLIAIAADLKQAGAGFEAASIQYKAGEIHEGQEFADASLELALVSLNLWRRLK